MQKHLGPFMMFCCMERTAFLKWDISFWQEHFKHRYLGPLKLVLREYPVRFGMKLVELFPDLVSDKRGLPMLPVPVPSATEVFGGMDFGLDAEALWAEGSLVEVCRYLRGGKSLDIPEEFRPLLPKRLWGCLFVSFCFFLAKWFSRNMDISTSNLIIQEFKTTFEILC